MHRVALLNILRWVLVLAVVWAVEADDPAQAAFYWCPGKGKEWVIQDWQGDRCVPFVPEREKEEAVESGKASPPKDEFEAAVARFLREYRRFLACCAADPAEVERLRELEDQATRLLKQVESGMAQDLIKLRALQAHGVIAPVAQARQQLRDLRLRLAEIRTLQERVPSLDFEAGGRERRRLEELRDATKKAFAPSDEPMAAPPTGREIGVTPPTGPDIGHPAPSGPSIGTTHPTGPEIGTTPPSGPEIGVTPPTGPAIGAPRKKE